MEGIQFIIDIQERLEGAVAASAELRKLYANAEKADHAIQGFEGKLKHVNDATKLATHAHGEHGSALLNLGHHFEELSGSARTAAHELGLMLAFEGAERAFEVVEGLVDKFAELGGEAIKVAAATERVEKSLEFAVGEGPGRELAEWTEKIKGSTEFTGSQLRDYEAHLARVGMKVPAIQRTIAASLDIAALSGKGQAGMEGAIEAFERLQRTGKVENRMLGGLGFGERDFARLDKFARLSKVELQKAMESGSVTINDVEELIFKRTGKALGSLGVEMSQTMNAALTHLGEAKEGLFEGLAHSPGYARLTKMVLDLNERLNPDGPVGSKLFSSIEQGLTGFVNALAKVDVDKFTGDIVHMFEVLPPLISATTTALVGLEKVMHFVMDNLLVTPSSIQEHAHDKVSAPVGAMAWMLDKAFPNVRKSLVGENDALGFADGVKDGTPKAIDAISALGEKTTKTLQDLHENHSPSRLFERIAKFDVDGYVMGIERSAGLIPKALEAAFEPARDIEAEIPSPSAGARPYLEAMGGSAGMAGASVSISVSAPITVGGADATPEQIAEAIRIEVPSAVLSALEQAGLQMGAS